MAGLPSSELGNAVLILLPIFGGAAIIMTFYAAYLMLSANGDPAQFKEARKIFLLVTFVCWYC